MAGLSKVSFQNLKDYRFTISFDESIGGMLFDISARPDIFNATLLASVYFSNHQVQAVNNLTEAASMGLLDPEFMNGVVAYHIQSFYDYVGSDQKLYVAFADCKDGDEADFSFIEDMQSGASGEIFQLGIWTEQPILNDDYTLTPLISRIQQSINELKNINGSMGNGATSLSVMLFPHFPYDADYRRLPDLVSINAPQVSVFLGQEGSDAVHAIQDLNIQHTPVGMLGMVMAALALAGVENSIANVGEFDLNRDDKLLSPELGIGADHSPLEDIIETRRSVLTMKGYIILHTYESKDASVFLANDQALSGGDYNTISKNRIMHKVKRIIRRALLPRINDNVLLASDGTIATTEVASISNDIYQSLDVNMVNRQGQRQISARLVTVLNNPHILDNDQLNIHAEVTPVTSSENLNVEEGVVLSM